MARKLRVQFPGAIYHAMFRGNERRNIFRDDQDRRRFVEQVGDSVEAFGVRLYLICLMSNHVHMLLETPGANLSAFMRRLLTAYGVYFNRRHRRSGHLTQGRFRAQLVEGDAYLLKLSRYIHLNPVCTAAWRRRPLPERIAGLRAYPWSSFGGYAGVRTAWPFIDRRPLLALMGHAGLSGPAGYASYVEAGLAETDEEFRRLYAEAGLSIGSADFARQMNAMHRTTAGKDRRREDVALRRAEGRLPAGVVVQKVADIMGVDVSEIRRRRRNSPLRGAAAWALQRYAGLSQRQIADELAIGSGSAVSQQLGAWRRQVETHRSTRALQSRIVKAMDETVIC